MENNAAKSSQFAKTAQIGLAALMTAGTALPCISPNPAYAEPLNESTSVNAAPAIEESTPSTNAPKLTLDEAKTAEAVAKTALSSTASENETAKNEITALQAQSEKALDLATAEKQSALDALASAASQSTSAAEEAASKAKLANSEVENAQAELENARLGQASAQTTFNAALKTHADAQKAFDALGGSSELDALESEYKAASDNLEQALQAQTQTNAAHNAAKSELDKANTALTDSEKALGSAKQQKDEADEELEHAQDELKQAEADLKLAESGKQTEAEKQARAKVEACQIALDEANNNAIEAEATVETAQADADRSANELALAQENLEQANVADQKAADAVALAKNQKESAEIALNDAAEKTAEKEKALCDANATLERTNAELVQAQSAKEAADKTMEDAEMRLKAAQTAYNLAIANAQSKQEMARMGTLGFIEWMLGRSDLTTDQINDLNRAKTVIEDACSEDFSKWIGGENVNFDNRGNKVTVATDPKDAVSLSNLQHGIEIMKSINEMRAQDYNFTDEYHSEGKTNFYFMAVAQTGADRGAGLNRHSLLQVSCENLAFGYKDGSYAWLDERKSFDLIKSDLGITEVNDSTLKQINDEANTRGITIGHYTNLFWAQDQIMGVGWTNYRSTSCYNATKTPIRKSTAAYSVDEFANLLTRYNAFLGTDAASEAKANLDQAQENHNAANSAWAEAASRLASVQNAARSANSAKLDAEKAAEESRLNEAQTNERYQLSTEELRDATLELQKANATKLNAQNELASAKSKMNTADNQLAAARNTSSEANRNAEAAARDLANAKEYADSVSSDAMKAVQKRVSGARANLDNAIEGAAKADASYSGFAATFDSNRAAVQKCEQNEQTSQAQLNDAIDKVGVAKANCTELNTKLSPLVAAHASLQAAQSAKYDAQSRLESAARAVRNAEQALNEACEKANAAQSEYRIAALRANHLALFADQLQRERAFSEGVTDAWIIENEQKLVATIESKRAAYGNAIVEYDSLNAKLKQAQANLEEKNAAYQKAKLDYDKAVQAREAIERSTAQNESAGGGFSTVGVSSAHLVSKSITVEAASSGYPRTADPLLGEIFVVGGITFIAAGVFLGASRKRKESEE